MSKAADKPIKFLLIMNYLENKYDFRFNTVSIDLEYKPKQETDWKTLNPADLEVELLREGFTGFDKQLAALLKSSFVPRFDPILEYFESLPPWDNKTDYIGILANYVRTTDQEFYLRQFKKMLVRMVAQGLNAIAFNKHCFTFYSNQNDGKTYFFENLLQGTGLAEYSKKNIEFEGKDSKRSLAENFMINLDELAGLSKQDVNRAKAFFSESQIKLRLPYDKKDSIMSRRASFVGSTNQREFLVDETGNVRWIVFEVLSINHDNGGPNGYRAVDINKVWAQAYFLFQNDYPVQLDKDEIAHSENNNARYGRDSVEYQMLLQYFTPVAKEQGGTFYQPYKLVERLTQLASNTVRLTSENMGRALKKMGVEKAQTRIGQLPVWGYYLSENLLNVADQPVGTPDNPF
ncbi:VapE domain-containing protein [Spirosoma endbachense]|uniref:Virulence-associated protein E-like domain-containing protein n=1 Tax=Spirosoma endbachense TaxID=2666025 RepID=A0A6P1VXR8_9BACT|nr:VapE domain-containing protein [Spirosoma endbachense]QHV97555.1 hypothetical protein GJR95_22225 [Spirosoma endbachense]